MSALGQWALITGASEGLGRAFAELAARDGYSVILTARQTEKLEALATELRQRFAVEAVVIAADLAQAGEPERLWQGASQGREIAVLVNNAGLGANGAFCDPSIWAREAASVQVNIVAATVLLKLAVGAMVPSGRGRVLNVASVAGFMPGPHMAVYHATKAYLLSLSEAVSFEVAGSGVTVTALCPGATRTAFFAADGSEGATLATRMPLPSASSVAEAGWRAMQAGKRIKVTGALNWLVTFLPRLLPRVTMPFILAQFLKRR